MKFSRTTLAATLCSALVLTACSGEDPVEEQDTSPAATQTVGPLGADDTEATTDDLATTADDEAVTDQAGTTAGSADDEATTEVAMHWRVLPSPCTTVTGWDGVHRSASRAQFIFTTLGTTTSSG